MKTHGLSGARLYRVWKNMKKRCLNPNSCHYDSYGGRGITVCEEWASSPERFISWALASGWERGLQLDRKNNNGPYSPNNCRITTAKVNASNRRDTRYLDIDGESVCLADAANKYGIKEDTLRKRLNAGISPLRAIIPRDLRFSPELPK